MRVSTFVLGVLLTAWPSASPAAWQVAKSKHFIIYADDRPKTVQDFATKLERFDQAARVLLRMDDPPVGDGNRVTVFVVPTDIEVRRLAGDRTGFLQGFYKGRVEGSVVYVPKKSDFDGGLGANPILYHEYSHHLMMQQLDQPYPEWYVEGFAEFMSTPKFEKDGSVGLGTAPLHRAYSLFNKSLPLEALFTSDVSKLSADQRETLYGRAWLLTHFLIMEQPRKGQLTAYVQAISKGQPSLEAARATFGDFTQLDKNLESYLNRSRIMYFKIPGAKVQPGPIDVEPVSAGGAEIMPLRWRIKNGVAASEAEAIAGQARQIEGRYPGDELVETTLAEAELDASHYQSAEAAANRAIKANPRSPEALLLKGRAMLERAAVAEGDQTALFAEARKTFIAANKIDAEDPEPLLDFYQAYVREGVRPTANAIDALHYASNLAPQDVGVRMNSALAYLNEGKTKEARETLVPVAYSPHGGGASAAARRVIARIDAGEGKEAAKAAFSR
jgi:tetratricopeptide (TPR) repeat protein